MSKAGQPDDPTELTAGRRSLMAAFSVGAADSEMMRMAANWMRDLVKHRGLTNETLETNPLYRSLMDGTCTSAADQARVVQLIGSWVLNPNDRQVGGEHYRSAVQHWDFVSSRGMSYLGGQVTKYATRWRKKNGLQDVEKAIHFLEKLIDVTQNPVVPIELEEFINANPHLTIDEAAVIGYLVAFDIDSDLEHLRRARVHLERLWLAAGGPPR